MFHFQKTADLTYTNEIPTSVYNPSGMYGLKAMGVSRRLQGECCAKCSGSDYVIPFKPPLQDANHGA